jgi:hypothetical protein
MFIELFPYNIVEKHMDIYIAVMLYGAGKVGASRAISISPTTELKKHIYVQNIQTSSWVIKKNHPPLQWVMAKSSTIRKC